MDNGIVVGFDDGKTTFYSASLLLAMLPRAQMMPSDLSLAIERRASKGHSGLGQRAFLSAASYAMMAGPIDKAKVLVVDDEPIVGKTLEMIFKNAGHDVVAVESAEAALVLLGVVKWVPQFAIVDVHLPGMNGVELAIKLKTHYPEVRICLFSGRAATSDLVEEARRQGHSFHVIAKPVHPSVFLEMILGPEPPDETDSEEPPTAHSSSLADCEDRVPKFYWTSLRRAYHRIHSRHRPA